MYLFIFFLISKIILPIFLEIIIFLGYLNKKVSQPFFVWCTIFNILLAVSFIFSSFFVLTYFYFSISLFIFLLKSFKGWFKGAMAIIGSLVLLYSNVFVLFMVASDSKKYRYSSFYYRGDYYVTIISSQNTSKFAKQSTNMELTTYINFPFIIREKQSYSLNVIGEFAISPEPPKNHQEYLELINYFKESRLNN